MGLGGRSLNIQTVVSRVARTLLVVLLVAAGITTARASETARQGLVQFSNGEVLEGAFQPPKRALKLHLPGEILREIPFADIEELRFFPEKESLERPWRFVEAGRTEKEYVGDPYPLRWLRVALVVRGETLTGHLYTTLLQLQTEDGRHERVLLPAQQKGEPGQTLADLVYPARIVWRGAPGKPAPAPELSLPALSRPGSELVALGRDSLSRFASSPGKSFDSYTLPPLLGEKVFLALEASGNLNVGWPEQRAQDVDPRVRAHLSLVRDFFDERRLLGTFCPDVSGDIWSLLLLERRGDTSLPGAEKPWRLEVWRWKSDGERLMFAARGMLFRGMASQDRPVPTCVLDANLWRLSEEMQP